MTADAELLRDRANDALEQMPTLDEAMGCLDCIQIFRNGAHCPSCGSRSLINVADALSERQVVQRLDDVRRGVHHNEED